MKTNYTVWCRERIEHYQRLGEQRLVEMFEVALRLCLLNVEGIDA